MSQTFKRLTRSGLAKAVLLVVILAVFLGYNHKVFTSNNSIHYDDPNAERESLEITGNQVEQLFFANEPVRAVEIILYQGEGPDAAQVLATLADHTTGQILGQAEQTLTFINGAARARFEFADTETFSITEYALMLQIPESGRHITAHVNLDDDYAENLVYNGEVIEKRLIFEAIYANNLLLAFLIFTLAILALSLALLFFPMTLHLKPERLFFILALVSGIAIILISPSGQEPDAGDHILRAFDVSYGNVTPVLRRTTDDSVQMPDNFSIFDDTIIDPYSNQGLTRTRDMMNEYFADDFGHNNDYHYNPQYSLLSYYPQGLGLYLGRIWSLNQFYTLSLARLLNLLVYIGLTYLAIAKMPVFKNLQLVIALLPISVFQASSLSADAVINGFSFLFVALLLEILERKKPVKLVQYILPVLLLYIVYLAKPAYIPMLMLLLIIPFHRYAKAVNLSLSVLIFLAVTAVIGFIGYGFLSGLLMLNEGLPAYETQLQFVLHNLYPTLQIFFHTLNVNALQYISWLNYLGWINYSLGILIVLVPVFLVVVGLMDRDETFNLNKWQRSVILLTFALNTAAIFFGLYIFDDVNDIGASLMLGVQGRYFLPLFILPFLAIQSPVRMIKDRFFSTRVAGYSGLILTYAVFMLTKMIY